MNSPLLTQEDGMTGEYDFDISADNFRVSMQQSSLTLPFANVYVGRS